MGATKRSRPDAEVPDDNGDVHPSRKRRMEYTKEDAQLAKIYNDLADDVNAVRLKAAGELLKIINGKSADQTDRVQGVLNRLIKGLCSGRKAARLGFSIALSEVLRVAFNLAEKKNIEEFGFAKILEKIFALTQTDGNPSGQEKRDYLIGRRFAYHAVLQSDVVSSVLSADQWRLFLDAIAALAEQKQWVRSECGAMLFDYLRGANGKTLPKEHQRAIIESWRDKSLLKSPEGIAIWIAVSQNLGKSALPKGVWEDRDPLSSKERTALKKILHGSALQDEQETTKASSGARQTQPSFAWRAIFQRLYAEDDNGNSFRSFWNEAVDNGLFAASSSTERKSLGLQTLSIAILSAPPHVLPTILSSNVSRYIVSQRADSGKLLFEAAKASLHGILVRVKADPATAGGFLKGMVGAGFANFDQLTKTRTIETILSTGDHDSLGDIADVISEQIMKPGGDDKEVENRRRSLADLILLIVRSFSDAEIFPTKKDSGPSLSDLHPALLGIFSQTILLAYGLPNDTDEESRPPLSDSTKNILRTRMTSCLSHLLNQPIETAATALRAVVKIFQGRKSAARYLQRKDARKTLDEAWKHVGTASASSKSSEGPAKTAMLAYQLLIGLAMTQVYNEEPDAVEVLQDLCTSFKSRDSGTNASTMIIEILLSFISKPSALFRKLAEQVFSSFASELTEEGMQSLLDILDQKEDLSGQQELFEQREGQGDEDDDVAMEDVEDVEDASDVEIVNGEVVRPDKDGDDGASAGGSSPSESSSPSSSSAANSNSDEEEEEEEEEDPNLLALDAKLTAALRTDATTDPNASDSDSDMDDDQMMALEPHLQAIFAERAKLDPSLSSANDGRKSRSKKDTSRDAKQNMLNFKNRVLDLLMLYVKSEYASPLTLGMVVPMVRLVRRTKGKVTAEKGFAVLRGWVEGCNRFKRAPKVTVGEGDEDEKGVGVEEVFAVLEEVFEEMRLEGSKLHANACSRAALFLSKMLVGVDVGNYGRIAGLYAKLQSEWYVDAKSRVQGSVFTEWTSWSLTTRKQMQK